MEETILDIIATADTPYGVAWVAALIVATEGWNYEKGPTPRSVTICPDFEDEEAERIVIQHSA